LVYGPHNDLLFSWEHVSLGATERVSERERDRERGSERERLSE